MNFRGASLEQISFDFQGIVETPSAEPCTEAGAVAGAEGVVKPPRFECTIWDPQKQGIQNSQPFGFFINHPK